MSKDIAADTGFLCGNAAMLGDTIKGTACRWDVGFLMRERKEKCELHFNWNV